MSRETSDAYTLRAGTTLARQLVEAGEEAVATKDELLLLARCVERLHDALRHYESAISWDISCTRCAGLLGQLHTRDQQLEEARAAWLVALERLRAPHPMADAKDGK